MDTNTLNMLLELMARRPQVANGQLDWGQITNIVLMIGMIAGSVYAAIKAKSADANVVGVKATAESLSVKVDESKEVIDKVHLDVNSGKTAMEAEIKRQNEVILKLTQEVATIGEKMRGVVAIKDAVAIVEAAKPIK